MCVYLEKRVLEVRLGPGFWSCRDRDKMKIKISFQFMETILYIFDVDNCFWYFTSQLMVFKYQS